MTAAHKTAGQALRRHLLPEFSAAAMAVTGGANAATWDYISNAGRQNIPAAGKNPNRVEIVDF